VKAVMMGEEVGEGGAMGSGGWRVWRQGGQGTRK